MVRVRRERSRDDRTRPGDAQHGTCRWVTYHREAGGREDRHRERQQATDERLQATRHVDVLAEQQPVRQGQDGVREEHSSSDGTTQRDRLHELVLGDPGLPDGTYLATVSANFHVAAVGKAVLCRFDVGGAHELLSYGAPAQFNAFSTANSAGVITVAGSLSMLCNSQSNPPDSWNVYESADSPSLVTFTRVDAATAGTPVATRTAAGAAGRP